MNSKTFVAHRHWAKIRNLGDAINPYILERATGLYPVFVEADQPHILAIGSILFSATPKSYIWGSGVLLPSTNLPPIKAEQVRALRGKLTYQHLRHSGVNLGDIPLGDPGYLAPMAILPDMDPLKTNGSYRVCVVPHHGSVEHEFYHKMALRDDVRIANIFDDTLDTLRMMQTCEVVISESLHGLIFAEALGLPSVWISRRNTDDWKFKFRDWFSTTHDPDRQPFDLGVDLDHLIKEARLAESTIDRSALIAAVPKEETAMSAYPCVDFRFSRATAPMTMRVEAGLLEWLIERKSPVESLWPAVIKELRRTAYATLSTPVYAVLTDRSAIWPQRDLEKIAVMLDEKPDIAMGVLVSKAELVENAHTQGVPLNTYKNVTFSILPRSLKGDVLLRPTLQAVGNQVITIGL